MCDRFTPNASTDYSDRSDDGTSLHITRQWACGCAETHFVSLVNDLDDELLKFFACKEYYPSLQLT